MRAVLAGGGTGGHVIPALAIAQDLKSRLGAEVLFIGTARGIETRLVPASGFELRLIEVGALKRVSLATRAKTLLDLPRAILASSRILGEFRPDVVIGVGGYASGPAMLAAALRRIPTLIFEPNVVPGFANKMVAPLATAAAVHFEATCQFFKRCTVTGVPVRQRFFEIPARAMNDRPSLLLFGGSQGSHILNTVLVEALPQLAAALPGLHIVHQTGEKEYESVTKAYLDVHISAEVSPFIDNMAAAFAGADLLVCRSGASTVAEVTAAAKPALFVPFAGAADNHQFKNAELLARNNAAVLMEEKELNSQRFAEEVIGLLKDRARLRSMSEAARKLSHPNAAGQIAELAVRISGKGKVAAGTTI
jgi:UDP-N-acetylglucosamine--N-acetylmuramyl-(pentapeptide) pyrophosphoryl-undecaprenol N-acetylglucosamine transferase